MTQNDFAAVLKISRSVLGSYEEGRATPPYEKLIQICDTLDIKDIRDFLTNERFSTDIESFPINDQMAKEKALTTLYSMVGILNDQIKAMNVTIKHLKSTL